MTERQYYALCTIQSLLGVISANFRFVSVAVDSGKVFIRIVLRNEDDDDLEEIEDFKTEFEALLSEQIDYVVSVEVSDRPLAWPDENSIVVFKQRE
ncbi:MAG: hypothetical protein ACE37H_07810 [Phycisphaeraceae bacterium]